MKILILEDDPLRQLSFKENLKLHDVTIVDTSKFAIEKLKTEKYNLLFLDHDLGGQVYVTSGENTGYEVAKFLEENKQHLPETVIVHTLNPGGGDNIMRALPSAIRLPFAWIKTNLQKLGLI
jgi:CheY-like chemotaxis protein